MGQTTHSHIKRMDLLGFHKNIFHAGEEKGQNQGKLCRIHPGQRGKSGEIKAGKVRVIASRKSRRNKVRMESGVVVGIAAAGVDLAPLPAASPTHCCRPTAYSTHSKTHPHCKTSSVPNTQAAGYLIHSNLAKRLKPIQLKRAKGAGTSCAPQ